MKVITAFVDSLGVGGKFRLIIASSFVPLTCYVLLLVVVLFSRSKVSSFNV